MVGRAGSARVFVGRAGGALSHRTLLDESEALASDFSVA